MTPERIRYLLYAAGALLVVVLHVALGPEKAVRGEPSVKARAPSLPPIAANHPARGARVTRDLFTPLRAEPVAIDPTPVAREESPETAVAAAPDPYRDIQILGIVAHDTGGTVLIGTSGETHALREGDRFGLRGLRIQSVSRDRVVLVDEAAGTMKSFLVEGP